MKTATLLSLLATASLADCLDVSTCDCGFYDAEQHNIWTDSIIVYFNETTEVPSTFVRENYQNKYEQGWNSQFIPGAALNNSWIGNSSTSHAAEKSLQLFLSPANQITHQTPGGSIRSQRQDIQYGSFRACMKGPRPFAGGSSLSMTLEYNLTQQITLNIMNTDDNETAWISTLMNHEFPNLYLGANFTNIVNSSYGANPLTDPWGYNDMRIDWTAQVMNYWLGKNLSRSVSGDADDGSPRPSVPMPLRFKHWSDGNEYSMGGPPQHDESEANVLYVRAFFNTTTLNSTQQATFNEKCSQQMACSTEDLSLRGFTAYSQESTYVWEQAEDAYILRWPAVGILTIALLVSISTLGNVILRRLILPSEAKPPPSSNTSDTYTDNSSRDNMAFTSGGTTPLAMHRSPYVSGYMTPATPSTRTVRESSAATSVTCLSSPTSTRPSSIRDGHEVPAVPPLPNGGCGEVLHRSMLAHKGSSARYGEYVQEIATTPSDTSVPGTPFSPFSDTRNLSFLGPPPEMPTFAPAVIGDTGNERVTRDGVIAENVKGKAVPVSSSAAPAGDSTAGGKPAPRQKIDYLAGLLAVCSTLVSLTHYALTFLPATIESGSYAHYDSENWARKTIGWFFFNEIWVVLFFTTSSRFLTTKYLRTGDLSVIAEKATSRTFRLMIPIIGVILLEYFLMDVGALDWLQFLPSISWSTWPYTVVYSNFGSFVSETLELIYTVPNAQPQITFNYCTGVLWTIPVQLDGSWQAMLSVIVFFEIKNVYKRFSYYFIVIIAHWYARSWGGLFVAGLCMADLDVTYKYRKSLYAKKWLYYPLLNVVILLCLASLANDLISQWTGHNFQIIEDGWHIDRETGQALVQSGKEGFPPYYVPKLNSLTFAVGAQLLVEWSTVVQKCISIKIILWLFPHIFTIYLFHGFIFWSIGSAVCVGLGAAGLPYWANMLVTAFVCYASMYLSLPIITPVVEALGKSVTMSIWASASERPAPKRATTFPFPKDLFTSRNLDSSSDGSGTNSSSSSFSEKENKVDLKSTTSSETSGQSRTSLVEQAIAPGDNKWPLVNEKPIPF